MARCEGESVHSRWCSTSRSRRSCWRSAPVVPGFDVPAIGVCARCGRGYRQHRRRRQRPSRVPMSTPVASPAWPLTLLCAALLVAVANVAATESDYAMLAADFKAPAPRTPSRPAARPRAGGPHSRARPQCLRQRCPVAAPGAGAAPSSLTAALASICVVGVVFRIPDRHGLSGGTHPLPATAANFRSAPTGKARRKPARSPVSSARE